MSLPHLLILCNGRSSVAALRQHVRRRLRLPRTFPTRQAFSDLNLKGRGKDTARLQKLLFPDTSGTLTGRVPFLL